MASMIATIERPRLSPFLLDAGRFAPANRRRVSGPGLRAFLAIADLWRLMENERLLILGAPPRSTYYGWIKTARDRRDLMLPTDTLIRISAVLGIHKALQILFPTEIEGTGWLRGPHQSQPFAGQAPIALIAGGMQDGLMAVRRFLDAARGGQWMPRNDADLAEPITDQDIVFA